MSFWNTLPKPFFVMAPMANVTDSVFRRLFAAHGAPHVTWTEFVSADGLISPGREKLLVDLEFSRAERPIVAQLFTGHPEAMRRAAALVAKMTYDGIDINMGCPDRAVEKQGGGASLTKDPKRAVEIIRAARQGVADAKRDIPVSVKTRLGYNKVDFEWLRAILAEKPPAFTVHLRTRKEMSEVPAHWELIPEIVRLRDEVSPGTRVIGNGDVESIADARAKCAAYGCDGVMIGRGIFGAPWFFENIHARGGGRDARERSPEERLTAAVDHSRRFEKAFKGVKSFAIMRKHFKAYVSGWDGAKELRAELMETENAKEVAAIVKVHLARMKGAR